MRRRTFLVPLPRPALPVPTGLPSIETMLTTPPARTRRVAFETCGDQAGGPVVPIPMEDPTQRLPSCGAYYHQNHFLVTHVNGRPLPLPEWHDTILVPAAEPQPAPPAVLVNINEATFGSVTIRTYPRPVTEGAFVMHCHMVQHEDLGMMQRVEVVPANVR